MDNPDVIIVGAENTGLFLIQQKLILTLKKQGYYIVIL